MIADPRGRARSRARASGGAALAAPSRLSSLRNRRRVSPRAFDAAQQNLDREVAPCRLVGTGQQGGGACHAREALGVGVLIGDADPPAFVARATATVADGAFDGRRRGELRDEVDRERGTIGGNAAGFHERQLMLREAERAGQNRDRAEGHSAQAGVALKRVPYLGGRPRRAVPLRRPRREGADAETPRGLR